MATAAKATKPAPKPVPKKPATSKKALPFEGGTKMTAVTKAALKVPVNNTKTKAETTAPKFKFPKTMGACADLVYELRNKRLTAQKVAEAIETEEKALREHIINSLPKSQTTGVAGKVARVTVTSKDIPQVEDWPKFYAYVVKNKAFDMMQRRLSTEAVQSRLDEGKKVAGVKVFKAVTLSINKI